MRVGVAPRPGTVELHGYIKCSITGMRDMKSPSKVRTTARWGLERQMPGSGEYGLESPRPTGRGVWAGGPARESGGQKALARRPRPTPRLGAHAMASDPSLQPPGLRDITVTHDRPACVLGLAAGLAPALMTGPLGETLCLCQPLPSCLDLESTLVTQDNPTLGVLAQSHLHRPYFLTR